MMTRVKRLINRLGYRKRVRVPMVLITGTIVLFTAFIVGGGIYNFLDNPPPVIWGPQGVIAVFGSTNDQTQLESLMSMVFTVLIFIGLVSSYRSTRVVYDSRRATTMLFLGIILVLLGLSGSYFLLILKRSVLRQYGF